MNDRGRANGTQVYELADPRDDQVRYVGRGTGAEPWLTPVTPVRSYARHWLQELKEASLTPRLLSDALPGCWLSERAAKWIVRKRRKELIAAGFTVMTHHCRINRA